MKVDSCKKSLISGVIIGAIQLIFLTAFMAVILYLTDGEWFFYKEGMHKQIGNIRLDNVDKFGYIVAAIVMPEE